ncbi:MAG: MATE family efflux transporter [Deltaproteobacteria bacterium]|nr:MATE family efflux transporter [Deltaproteobacteria bacterium]
MKLALPLAAQQLGFQLMGIVDAALVGHRDETLLAAAGVGNNLLFAITCVGIGVVMGLDSVIPRAFGAGREEEGRRALHAGVKLAVLVGIVATLLVFASPLVLGLVGVPDAVERNATIYVWVRGLGTVPWLAAVALRGYLAARGVTRPLVYAVIGGNLVNAGLDLVLIFGVPAIGFPALGIVGAALATLCVQIATLAMYALAVRTVDGGRPLPRSSRADLRAIARYGAPVGGQLFAEVGIFGVSTLLAAHLGTVPGAGHSIALNLSSLTFSVAVGIGASTSVRVGHAIGAGDVALARRRGLLGTGLGLGVMASCALVFLAVPGTLAALFTRAPDVVAATIPLLQIAALFQLSDGVQAIAAGALRGAGDTRATLVGNVVGHYGVGLAISLALAFPAGLGAPGLWWGLSAGLTVTAAYLLVRFLRLTSRTGP